MEAAGASFALHARSRRTTVAGRIGAFKKNVREQLRVIADKWGRLLVPLEVDVQVPEESGGTATDLDNVIRRYVAPALTTELLAPPDGFLAGYRIVKAAT